MAADATGNVDVAREVLNKSNIRDGSITAGFEHIGKGKVTYSTRQHTKAEVRYELLHLH